MHDKKLGKLIPVAGREYLFALGESKEPNWVLTKLVLANKIQPGMVLADTADKVVGTFRKGHSKVAVITERCCVMYRALDLVNIQDVDIEIGDYIRHCGKVSHIQQGTYYCAGGKAQGDVTKVRVEWCQGKELQKGKYCTDKLMKFVDWLDDRVYVFEKKDGSLEYVEIDPNELYAQEITQPCIFKEADRE